jgi:hypothetical protein
MNSPDAKHRSRSAGTAERPAEAVILPQPALEPQSFKIHGRHRDRLAVVYVRQSTPQQVLEHRESTARQYALADRALPSVGRASACWSSTTTKGAVAGPPTTAPASSGCWPS